MTESARQDAAVSSDKVTLTVMGEEVVYDKIPERVIVIGYDNAELMAKLGLEDKIIGLTPCMYRPRHCYPELCEKIKEVPVLPQGKTPEVCSFETILSEKADRDLCHVLPFFR